MGITVLATTRYFCYQLEEGQLVLWLSLRLVHTYAK